MECLFGDIQRGKMILNDFGKIAYVEWLNLPFRFENVQLHTFQIMPNHMHGIIKILYATKAEDALNKPEASLDTPEAEESLNKTDVVESLTKTGAEESLNKRVVNESLNKRVVNESLNIKEAEDSLNKTEAEDSLNKTEAEASPATTISVREGLASSRGNIPLASASGINFLASSRVSVREGPASSRGMNLLASSRGMNILASCGNNKYADDEIFKTLSDIMCAYKSIVANTCLELHKQKFIDSIYVPRMGKIWQRSFWDHIIRDASSYKSIARYIRNNPKKWNRTNWRRKYKFVFDT